MERTLVALLALVLVVGFGCAQPPPGGIYYASGRGSVTPEGLHRVDWEPFRATYVKPGAELQRYDKVWIQEVTIAYKTPPPPIRQPLSNRRPVAANYALPDTEIATMKRYFHEAFEKSLGKSGNFEVTDSPGPDVLLLSGRIIDLKITVPPERYQSADSRYYSDSPGKLTLVLDAKDSQSGESLMRIGERRDIEMNDGGIYQTDPVSSSGALQQLFREWADDLRRQLDAFRTLPKIPPAPAS